ncbi:MULTISPECIES: phage tail protein [unclassified Mameliella]|uniref:phage tail protein n=1 Tax=unclassified Mameliella TaxID=2630630 RepID=UPI00273F63A6|nr:MULTISPECIES: phage tail protein [unclassified Mameliella]
MPQVDIPEVEYYRRRTRNYDVPPNNISDLIAAVVSIQTPTGALIPTLATAAPNDAWAICDGSALLKADYPDLYAVIGAAFGETPTTFNLPDLRGRSVMGAGGGPALALLGYGGAASINLTVDQLPAHTHTITDPGHDHTFSGGAHTHGVTDPGHGHSVTDPGHSHTITDAGHDHTDETSGSEEVASGSGATVADYDGSGSTTSDATGVTVDSATTGATVDSATTGVTVDSASVSGTIGSNTTGVSADSTGSGDPVDIIPPVVAVNWMIRT